MRIFLFVFSIILLYSSQVMAEELTRMSAEEATRYVTKILGEDIENYLKGWRVTNPNYPNKNSTQKSNLFAQIIRELHATGASGVIILTSTDGRGSKKVNFNITRIKAKVLEAGIAQMLPKISIRLNPLGKEWPIDTNTTVAGRQKNRRYEIIALE